MNEVLDHTNRAHTVYVLYQVGFYLLNRKGSRSYMDSVERGLQNLPFLVCRILCTPLYPVFLVPVQGCTYIDRRPRLLGDTQEKPSTP